MKMFWNLLKNLPNHLKIFLSKTVPLANSKGLFDFYKKFCYNDYRNHEEKEMKNMSNLFERISAEDREAMMNYIRWYAPSSDYDTTGEFAELSYLLRFWENAKNEYLADMFGDKLILEREIEIETPVEALSTKFRCDYRGNANHFWDDLYRTFADKENELLSFFECLHLDDWYGSVYAYISRVETLMKNKWELPEVVFPLPNGKKFKVCPGTKITRVLGTLAKAYNMRDWEQVREAHAKTVTAKYTKGTLCLSIHPFDYITMSDNCERWDSCMNWKNDGGYRAGTVEMMNSPCVVVAYLKHPTHKLDDYWNSKVWRELYIVHPEVITNIKAYPYANEELTKQILAWIKNLMEANTSMKYKSKLIELGSDSYHTYIPEENITVNFTTDTMYNDCGRAEQWIYLGQNANSGEKIYINYSGTRNCMMCGSIHVDFEDDNEVCCNDCEYHPSYYCECCGTGMTPGDFYEMNGEYYCTDCFHEKFVEAYDTHEFEDVEECTLVQIMLPNDELTTVGAYVHNLDNLEFEVQLNEEEEYYVPYAKANKSFRRECGIHASDEIIYDNWHLPKDERRKLLEQYYKEQEELLWF